jgi:type II restriction/modification system DNA methylase subunit YeeA
MNRNKLKQYAPQARRDFIAAVTDRAAYYGLTKQYIQPITEQGDVALMSGKPFPRNVAEKRKRLEGHIKQQGFEQVMEAMAYTWFNRLVAIRFMELHGYLDHGYRVLSHPEGKPTPEILEHAEHVDLPGLKKETVIELKLAGNKEGELYRLLLTAHCNALHTAMPFLFEKIDDETELLLPENLLHSDSLIRKLVREIDAEDWQEVEIIGWLYQFYISEKKDQVIGKVVASEDIPAATQLFTPNWIVKYLVQNSLGRQWLATYPQSALRQQMEYYIEPSEQTPEVQEQLKAITPTSLNPEDLTLLDPACGSGHILVEAYDLFKAIYQERGYRAKDIPALILQRNLFGLEIDDRAAQLAAFALMMKARGDDRRIFDSEAKPNILAFQDSRGIDAADITHALNAPINKEDVPSEYLFEEIEEEKVGLFSRKALAEKGHVSQGDIASLLALFENAKTFGSLIQVPPRLAAKLPEIEKRLDDVLRHGDLTHASAHVLKPLLQQASFLARKYDFASMNPPYAGVQFEILRAFARKHYPDSKTDLFSMFIERGFEFLTDRGLASLVTMHSWMFLSSFQTLREKLLSTKTLICMAHFGIGAFSELNSKVVQSTAFVSYNRSISNYRPVFFGLTHGDEEDKRLSLLKRQCKYDNITQEELGLIPGSPIAYWAIDRLRRAFSQGNALESISKPKAGISTGNNSECIYYWWEANISRIGFGQSQSSELYRFYPHNKGGGFRRWFGNCCYVLKYSPADISRMSNYPGFRHDNSDFYFQASVSWGKVTSLDFCARYYPQGFTFDGAGLSLFFSDPYPFLALLNSKVFSHLVNSISNTLNFTVGDIGRTPVLPSVAQATTRSHEAVSLSRQDWDSSELSWDYCASPLVSRKRHLERVAESFHSWEGVCSHRLNTLRDLEIENNEVFIRLYGLQGELSPEVSDDQITLYRPNREEDIKRLLSYAIGCMMGRYSLDKPGLVYASRGNEGFDPSQYKTFRADDDGIFPLLEADWGIRDDAANRFVEFVGVAWPKEHLEENLKFIADSLGQNNGEQPWETIRRYLALGFYKHHLSMYKKRPIFWLFSSGKQRAFQCLVYLHRYNESTLSRMRIEYVIPLQGKISSRIGQLADDIAAASSTSHRKKLEKERDTLVKQQAELRTFDEKLRHYADLRISLDLDDGVKVNYGKVGDLLADVKAVTGGTEEP